MRKPKILFYDLETTPNLGYTWGKYQQNVIQFQKRRELLSFAYSYEGQSKIICETREGKKTDKKLVIKLHKILEDADISVAHNGDSFDNRVARARMIFHGLRPLKTLSTIDTKRSASAYFMFDSNSLDDLCQYLKIGKKMATPGFSLWTGCMEDDPKSWRIMARYNKHDVKLLKEVYQQLRPWIINHPNIAKLLDPHRSNTRCPNCAGKHIQSKGYRASAASVLKRWRCMNQGCGREFLARIGAAK